MRPLLHIGSIAVSAAVMLAAATPALAQDDSNAAITAQTELMKAEKDKLKAEADKITAQADLERTRISSLGLPSYQGTTKLNQGAGEMEAMLLTAPAVNAAGTWIAAKVTGNKEIKGSVLLLTRDDAFDFSSVGSITAELDGLIEQYHALGGRTAAGAFVPGAVAVISAIAGMVRSETEVTAATVTVPDTMLLAAVASGLAGKALLPAGAIAMGDSTKSKLVSKLSELSGLDASAQLDRSDLAASNGGKPGEAEKAKIAAIDVVRKRYDSLFVRLTTADDKGAVPIARAARLELLMEGVAAVLRVHVEKSGGSFVNSKNIATFFGADPVRISGGLVVSFILTNPLNGTVIDAGIFRCRTGFGRLRQVQEGTLNYRRKPTSAQGAGASSGFCE